MEDTKHSGNESVETAAETADFGAGLALPLAVDSGNYPDIVVRDARWRRVAAFPKTRGGRTRAQQVVSALNAHQGLIAALQAIRDNDGLDVGAYAAFCTATAHAALKAVGHTQATASASAQPHERLNERP